MKKQKVFILWLLFLLPTFCLADLEPIDRWTVQDFWSKLEIRMTDRQAIELLGSPVETEEVNASRIWYYSELPQRQGDRMTYRPENGCLMFRQSPTDSKTYLLIRWNQPDWTTTPPHTEKEYQTRLQRIESQNARAQAILNRQALAEQRKAEAEKRKIQQQTARQKQIEQTQQRRENFAQQHQQRQQQATKETIEQTADSQQKKKPMTPAQLSSRLLIYGGIFIFITAVIIAILQGAKYLGKK